MKNWMIYGANGYTGQLIAREAASRGHQPILAGRSAEAIAPLARELGWETRVFALDDHAAIVRGLDGVGAVVHCAGPFMHTSKPMVRACLESGAHYLDITGELAVFEAIMARNDEAVARGVVLLPGVGFDVVPTDCLAAMLAKRLPNADELDLAFWMAGGGISRGTMKTMIEGIGEGGAVRRDGKIVRVPMLYDVRDIAFSIATRPAITIPWGDVSTAFHSTGIPNIRVYSGTSRRGLRDARWVKRLLPIFRTGVAKRLLSKFADRRTGPNAAQRQSARAYLWGRVARRGGEEVTMTMSTPEGYAFTALSSVRALELLLDAPARPGAYTPSRYFGAEFVRTIPGVEIP